MKPIVDVVSRNVFKTLMCDESAPYKEKFAVISISTVDDENHPLRIKFPDFDTKSEMNQFLSNCKHDNLVGFLTLDFLDSSPRGDENDAFMFNEEQAKQVIEFVEKTKDVNLLIHCTAGISRSAAVGAYASIVKDCEIDFWRQYGTRIRPNPHVLALLKRHLHTEN